jgi:succinate dehydrogenase / fumarate reductase, cytochrome b subunit
MNTQPRPVHLNLFVIRMPIMAVMSILHRASGALLVLAIPYFAYLLGLSLENESGFVQAQAQLSGVFSKLILLILGWGVLHHLLSGIRFLFIDFDIGVNKISARQTAWVVTITAAVISLTAGAILLGGAI